MIDEDDVSRLRTIRSIHFSNQTLSDFLSKFHDRSQVNVLCLLLPRFPDPQTALDYALLFENITQWQILQHLIYPNHLIYEGLSRKPEVALSALLAFKDFPYLENYNQEDSLGLLLPYTDNNTQLALNYAVKFSKFHQYYALKVLLKNKMNPESAVRFALKFDNYTQIKALESLLPYCSNRHEAIKNALYFKVPSQYIALEFLLKQEIPIKKVIKNSLIVDRVDKFEDHHPFFKSHLVLNTFLDEFRGARNLNGFEFKLTAYKILLHYKCSARPAAAYAASKFYSFCQIKAFKLLSSYISESNILEIADAAHLAVQFYSFCQIKAFKVLASYITVFNTLKIAGAALNIDSHDQLNYLEMLLPHFEDSVMAAGYAAQFYSLFQIKAFRALSSDSTNYNSQKIADAALKIDSQSQLSELCMLLPHFDDPLIAADYAVQFYYSWQIEAFKLLSSSTTKYSSQEIVDTALKIDSSKQLFYLKLLTVFCDEPIETLGYMNKSNLYVISLKFWMLIQDEWNFLLWGGDHGNRGDEVFYELPNNNSDDNDDDESGNAGIKMSASTANNNRDNTSTHTDNGTATEGGNDRNTSRSNGNSSSENSDNNYNTELTSIFIAKDTHITDASLIDYEPPTLAIVIDKHMDTGLAGMLEVFS